MVQQNKLRAIIEERGITPYRLAKDCNISVTLIYGALNGTVSFYPRWRKSIAEYLGMTEEEIFEEVE